MYSSTHERFMDKSAEPTVQQIENLLGEDAVTNIVARVNTCAMCFLKRAYLLLR